LSPDGDEQGGGAVRADAAALEQLRGVGFDRGGDALGEVVDLGAEVLDAVGEQAQRVRDSGRHPAVVGGVGVGQLGAAADEGGAAEPVWGAA